MAVQAFADDLAVVVSGKSVKRIERDWEKFCDVLRSWEQENHLRFNIGKSEAAG